MVTIAGSRSPHFHETLDRIYDAAFDREAFVNLASVLAGAMQAPNGILIVAENGVPIEQSATITSQAQKDYFAYYGGIDVWTPPTFELPPFTLMRSEERISDDRVLGSEFYRDYARHLDMWHPMGAACTLARDQTLLVGVNRTRAGRVFNQEEGGRLIELLRHTQRALQMRRNFQGVETRTQAGFATLDKLSFAAVVVDGNGRIVFANAKAEDLNRTRAGLTLGGGRIGCLVQRQAVEFIKLIRGAARGEPGGAIRLTDEAGAGGLLTVVSPMPSRLRESPDGTGLALVAASQEKDSPVFLETIVGQLFGLSRSEAQVTCAVVAGASLEEIAARRGVKMTTIKTQIEASFRKTGAENQRDLVRLVGKLPQLNVNFD